MKPISNYIQQKSLFSLEELFDLQEKSKLELIFENLNLNPVVNSLRNNSKKGQKAMTLDQSLGLF